MTTTVTTTDVAAELDREFAGLVYRIWEDTAPGDVEPGVVYVTRAHADLFGMPASTVAQRAYEAVIAGDPGAQKIAAAAVLTYEHEQEQS